MPLSPKRILIAPLDWGLGHTTRCIPVIRAIIALGHEPVFAGNKFQQSFIAKSFPDIRRLFLDGYDVRYSKRALMFTILWQLPRLARRISAEHKWLLKTIREEGIDGIISDNRYGLWHPTKPTVIITHQPGVMTGLGTWIDSVVRRIHYSYLGRFAAVWIPDMSGNENLAGSLAHPPALPPRTRYIGWLSQFHKVRLQHHGPGYILILLSGPEPQRSILADKLWEQALTIEKPIVFVEGKADVKRQNMPSNIRHLNLLHANDLQPLLEGASVVVCRSGYSTLMDLALFQKPAILIPTPGQTEQEYLASYLMEKGVFSAASQRHFNLEQALDVAVEGQHLHLETGGDQLANALEDWLKRL